MKNLILIILIGFLAGCSSGNMPLSKEFLRIENRAAETERMMSSFSSSDQTLSDGSLMTSYYHNGILKKIHIEKNITGGLESRDLYFHNWRISYITDSKTMLELGNNNNTTRNLYYFKDDKLIGWKKPGGDMITSGSEFDKRGNELMNDVEKYLVMNQ
jgi:hypothetical protein